MDQFNEMAEWLSSTLPGWAQILVTAVAAATVLVSALQGAIPPLRRLADETPAKWDNAAVRAFAKALSVLASALEFLRLFVAPLAARSPKALKRETDAKKGVSKLAILALLLVTTGCSSSLKNHAKIAVATGDTIESIATLIEAKAKADETALIDEAVELGISKTETKGKLVEIRKRYWKLEAAYESLRLAHAVYKDAIVRASSSGEKRLRLDPVTSLLTAWSSLSEASSKLGIEIPIPPSDLLKIAKGIHDAFRPKKADHNGGANPAEASE